MTDRIRSVHVMLAQNIRVDDAEQILEAIRMIKGVAVVNRGPVAGYEQLMAHATARLELEQKLWEALKS